MKIIRTVSELRVARNGAVTVGLVPTMGALHEGHLALMRRSVAENALTIATIFVNPTQFGPHEDFHLYPRPFEEDVTKAESAGVDILFAPAVNEVYREPKVSVNVAQLSDHFEGAERPGHFDGVATVVLKLFLMSQATRAYFGLKDLQQCAVIRKMVEDLDVPIELTFVETVRESDGLALSSRNRYLSPEMRSQAPTLYASIRACAQAIANGSALPDEAIDAAKRQLEESGFHVGYVAYVSPDTFQPLDAFCEGGRVIAACRLGTTRLIDNVACPPSEKLFS